MIIDCEKYGSLQFHIDAFLIFPKVRKIDDQGRILPKLISVLERKALRSVGTLSPGQDFGP